MEFKVGDRVWARVVPHRRGDGMGTIVHPNGVRFDDYPGYLTDIDCHEILEAWGLELVEREVFWGREDDNVNHPSHYNESGIECIEAIRATLGDEFPAYCKGNVMKYLWRYQYKNGIEDLKKAQVYLNWMVEYIEDNTKGET